MNGIYKHLSVFFTVFVASTLLFVMFAGAQSDFKPSVPEFTVKLVDRSYDVPLTYVNSTNPFTGKQETTIEGGYHVENRTVDVIIKNQSFKSANISGSTTNLYYVIRWKGSFENWSNTTGFASLDYYYYLREVGTQASNSDYTVKTYLLSSFGNVPEGGKIDFQVKAQVGYSYLYYGNHAPLMPIGTNFQLVNESAYSGTQTIVVSNQTGTPTDPASIGTIPEFSTAAFSLLIAIPLTITGIIWRKHQRQATIDN